MTEGSKLPKTSRFFDQSNLPDMKNYTHLHQNQQVQLNGSGAPYNPFSYPQQKTKSNLPFDISSSQSKINIVKEGRDSNLETCDNEIPTFHLTLDQYANPIEFLESIKEIGQKYGAVKIVPPKTDSISYEVPSEDQESFQADIQINPDLFWFQTNKLLNNPDINELENRLKFHDSLLSFYTSNDYHGNSIKKEDSALPGVTSNSHIPSNDTKTAFNTENSNTGITSSHPIPTFLNKLPMIDKRPLDLYKLFRSVTMRGGYEEVINKKLWAQIGRELGYRGKIMTSLSSSLKSSYLKILYPYEKHIKAQKAEESCLSKKRSIDDTHSKLDKKMRRHNSPLIIGSPKTFKRATKIKYRKGFLLNTVHHTELKQVNTLVTKPVVVNGDEINVVNDSSKANGSRSTPDSLLNIKKESSPKSSKNFISGNDGTNIEGSPSDITTPDITDVNLSTNTSTGSNKKKGRVATSKEASVTVPITPTSQLDHFLKSLADNPNIQDVSQYTSNIRFSSIYTLRQFIEKDSKFQEYLLHSSEILNQEKKSIKDKSLNLPISKLERLFWKIVSNSIEFDETLNDGLELESGVDLPSFINGSAFPTLGDDLMNLKYNLANNCLSNTPSNTGLNTPVTNQPSRQTNSSLTTKYGTIDYSSKIVKSALNSWNLHNLPILPNSLFGALSENDVYNQDLFTPTLNIGMTFSSENWHVEDHFSYLCNFQFFGGAKKWYFIPNSEFNKFESFLKKVSKDEIRIHINNNNWDYSSLMKYMTKNDNNNYEALSSSLENMNPPFPDYNNCRLEHTSEDFQQLIDFQKSKRLGEKDNLIFNLNQDILISPVELEKAGIKYTYAVQEAGEFIVKFPRSYSSTISFGLNLSEQVNFATASWLDYAIQGEEWLNSQLLLPNFSTFKLLTNLAQLLENSNNHNISFTAEVYEKASNIFKNLVEAELGNRDIIRKYGVKEIPIDEFNDDDMIADDDLQNVYPSKIVLNNTITGHKFSVSLRNYIQYAEEKRPAVIGDAIKPEMHYFLSDDKLKHLEKVLKNYSIDYETWMKNYENELQEHGLLTLKTLKSILIEGEKIYGATSSNSKYLGNKINTDSESYQKFKECIHNLRIFVAQASEFVDECQRVLSVKHQQRIRGGSNRKKVSTDNLENNIVEENILQRLIKLLDKIPSINFLCPEADQIVELQIEIENYERAARNFLENGKDSIQEFDDLISLGESFGVELPSLVFLKRVRDRLIWVKDFKTIEAGGDPTDTKTFNLSDLKNFYEKGKKILGSGDTELIEKLKQVIMDSENFERKVLKFLEFSTINEIDLNELDNLTNLLQSSVLFLNQDTFEKLVKLNDNYDTISKYLSFESSVKEEGKGKYCLNEIIHLQNAIQESGLKYEKNLVSEQLKVTKNWELQAKNLFRDDAFKSTLNRTISPNRTVLQRIQDSVAKNVYSFANDEQDPYRYSSGYLALKEEEIPENKCSIYCICRELEFGTMIGCDVCSEWYHVHCVQEIGKESKKYEEAEKYECPLCILSASSLTSDEKLNAKPKLEQLSQLLQEGESLLILPNNLEELKKLVSDCKETSEQYISKLEAIKNSSDELVYKIDQLKFYLRKIYGSSVMIEEFFIPGLSLLRELMLAQTTKEEGKGMKTVEFESDANMQEVDGKNLSTTDKITSSSCNIDTLQHDTEMLNNISEMPEQHTINIKQTIEADNNSKESSTAELGTNDMAEVPESNMDNKCVNEMNLTTAIVETNNPTRT